MLAGLSAPLLGVVDLVAGSVVRHRAERDIRTPQQLDCPVMDEQELLAAVHTLVAHNRQDLLCGRAGHGADHACLPADEAVDLRALSKELTVQYGRLRNLAMDEYVDPTVIGRNGAPLLTPFEDQVVEMRAW